ncbi:MAG TPA: hypothetical protein VJ904_09325, partial [Tichowtungia sp.]|nr:hypothetical protein [Tichowtungia sp.]
MRVIPMIIWFFHKAGGTPAIRTAGLRPAKYKHQKVNGLNRLVKTFAISLALGVFLSAQAEPEGVERDLTLHVNQFIGSTRACKGHLRPIASVPFGMVQFGPDTRTGSTGYVWEDEQIMGFTHTHMVGGGCNDYMDILFMPVVEDTSLQPTAEDMRQAYGSVFSHDDETSLPGYYRVLLQDENILAELTASERCGIHRYT